MDLKFDGNKALLQQDFIDTENGGRIPIELYAIKEETAPEGAIYSAYIDGVHWYHAASSTHATILYKLLKEHITEFMHYISIDGGAEQ